jgi:hypothetical protein
MEAKVAAENEVGRESQWNRPAETGMAARMPDSIG